MDTLPPPPVKPKKPSDRSKDSLVTRLKSEWRRMPEAQRKRLVWMLGFLGVLTLAMAKPLVALGVYASRTDLHSHIVLIPLVSVYLLHLRWGVLPGDYRSSPVWALVPMVAGLAALGLVWGWIPGGESLSLNDRLGCYAAAYAALVWAGAFLVLGARWVMAALFPLAFLIFLVPLPDGLTQTLETASQTASAEAAAWMFQGTGLPHLRDGNIFQLPGITIEVAQECSGIRSSWVLFITSLVAAEMFLRSQWRRFILVALVIPLGILRNGFRILVISWLCVEVGPHMINSIIHHRGGPLFFALSLIPLFLILWWLRRGEMKRERKEQANAAEPAAR